MLVDLIPKIIQAMKVVEITIGKGNGMEKKALVIKELRLENDILIQEASHLIDTLCAVPDIQKGLNALHKKICC